MLLTDRDQIFPAGGVTGSVMRGLDWSKSPLGPPEVWPQSLRTALSVMLASPVPAYIFWGPELAMLYNDLGLPFVGTKHPECMGQSIHWVLQEAMPVLGPLIDNVLRTGVALYLENLLIPLVRVGFLQDGYFSFSYIPIRDEAAAIAGIFVVVIETTGQVLGARRLALLRELSMRAALCQTVPDVLAASEEVVGQATADVPFALLYELRGERPHLVARAGLTAPDDPGAWPLAAVASSGRELEVDLTTRPIAEVTRALLLPLAAEGQRQVDFVLVVGLNPRLLLDEDARSFFGVVARQLATSIASTRALEEKVQRAAQLAELDRQKTQFFSNVSHEFRTPLTLILGPTEDALGSPARALHGEQLERVHANAQRLLKLVNSLLEFSRVEAGRSRAAFEPTDLATLTKGLANAFESVIGTAGLDFVVDCPPLPEPIWVDPGLWEKIVLNLVSNAFKFTFAGRIAVRLHATASGVELTVEDTGIGITADELPRIFQRFHRVEGSQGRSHEGSGIGLSLVAELVGLHGGQVSARSVFGEGTTFTVHLPAGHAHLPAADLRVEPRRTPVREAATFVREAEQWLGATKPATARPAPGPDAAKARVLLADDNADMRGYIERVLSERFVVDVVADGRAALAAACARPPDVVVSDVMMPLLDGIQLTRALRDDPRTRDLPIILLTARAGEGATVEGLEAGADDYIIKPFGARELVARVEAAVKVARAERARREAFERQAELEQQLIGIVSHDLRNPLSAILMGTSLLRQGPLDERAQRTTARIQQSADRAVRLVNDVLDFTQARLGGGIKIERRPVDLVEVMRGVVDELQVARPDRTLELVVTGGAGQGEWDPDRLAQIAHNLVTNAIKYSPPETAVRLHVHAADEHVEVRVHNLGTPIPAELVELLFQPMQRGPDQVTTAGRSVGLGLYIVKHIAVAHGGTVTVASSADAGTTFTVHLPRHPPV